MKVYKCYTESGSVLMLKWQLAMTPYPCGKSPRSDSPVEIKEARDQLHAANNEISGQDKWLLFIPLKLIYQIIA